MTLQMDPALSLLEHAGHTLPSRPCTEEWMQSVLDGLCSLSSHDAMTGLTNRRQFETVLEGELDRVARIGVPTLLLLVDIDHFKRVNDQFGHPAGDEVIKAVGKVINECVRSMDTVARIGGEEFAVVLPNCPPIYGSAVAERIRSRLARQKIPVTSSETVQVTVSVGGVCAPQWVRSSVKTLLERADGQLYRAKTQGRDQVCFEPFAAAEVSPEERRMLFAVPKDNDAAS